MPRGFDNYAINHQLLLGMGFEETIEGVGVPAVAGDYIYDKAKPHHRMTVVDGGTGVMTWGAVASGFPYLHFAPTIGAGVANYVWLEALAAAAADLDFTTEDFTLLAWVYLANLDRVHTIMCYGAQGVANGGGYQLNIGFSTPARLGFGTCQGATVQSSQSHAVLNAGQWYLLGATRVGADGKTFINGVDRTDAPDTHVDPDTQTEPFHLGVRQIETTGVGIDYDTPLEGYMAFPRVWDRALSDSEWLEIFNVEKHWFNL